MKNKYEKGTRLSERKYKHVLRLFAADVPAITTTNLVSLNYRTVHRLYNLWRERIVQLSLKEPAPFAGEIEARYSNISSG